MRKAAELLPRFTAGLADVPRAAPVIAAVSGGCDSVVLLDLLRRANFKNIVVAHLHHGLRGEGADHDAAFVRESAAKQKMIFECGLGDTRARARRKKESPEEAARALRRDFLARVAGKHGAAAVFLAHHAGDTAETLLFHLARGSGLRGLAALRPRAPLDGTGIILVRPMLGFGRGEIERYAAARRLEFCTDETNTSREHTRNRRRHDVVPALAAAVEFDPVPAMARAAEILAAEDDWLESIVAAEASAAVLDTRALAAMPAARQRRLLRAWLRARTGKETDFAMVERARRLAASVSAPAKMNLPGGHHLRRRAGELFVERPHSSGPASATAGAA